MTGGNDEFSVSYNNQPNAPEAQSFPYQTTPSVSYPSRHRGERGKMKAPLEMFVELVTRVRRDLYRGKPDKTWYAQQHLVKKALLYPARWLKQREVEIPAERYKAILEGIVATMVANGHLDRVTFMSRYLLTCVQQHMEHHGDEYYQEGVAIRNRVTLVMTAVERAHRVATPGPITVLAKAEELLQVGKRKAKPKPPRPILTCFRANINGTSVKSS